MEPDKAMVELTLFDFATLAICALRYCHGKRTVMSPLVRKIIGPYLPQIRDHDLKMMIKDCDKQELSHLYGGLALDRPGWIEWREALDKEMERRIIRKNS